jgi:large subunit ribosomal protein L15
MMQLNTIKPAKGSKFAPKRLGRGIGSGLGKTSGKGHKGQRARAGGYHKIGFEGGQMPLQRRMPKMGFASRMKTDMDEIRLEELSKVAGNEINLLTLYEAGLITTKVQRVKIILRGEITRAVNVQGLGVTKGAKAAIEKAGGTVE